MYDTVKGSDWLGDQDAIHYMCREAPRAVRLRVPSRACFLLPSCPPSPPFILRCMLDVYHRAGVVAESHNAERSHMPLWSAPHIAGHCRYRPLYTRTHLIVDMKILYRCSSLSRMVYRSLEQRTARFTNERLADSLCTTGREGKRIAARRLPIALVTPCSTPSTADLWLSTPREIELGRCFGSYAGLPSALLYCIGVLE